MAHRDINPENVLFDKRGRLKLADFGSAGWFGRGTAMRGLVGTAYYVVPEVVRGKEYNERVDVWSVGVVLCAILGGVLPFDVESAVEVLEARGGQGEPEIPEPNFRWGFGAGKGFDEKDDEQGYFAEAVRGASVEASVDYEG